MDYSQYSLCGLMLIIICLNTKVALYYENFIEYYAHSLTVNSNISMYMFLTVLKAPGHAYGLHFQGAAGEYTIQNTYDVNVCSIIKLLP